MIEFSKTSRRLLLIGLLLMSVTAFANARPSHQGKNKYYKNNHGQHASYRHYYPVGHRRSLLPAGYLALSYAGLNYYYHSGAYYQRIGHDYAVIRPPLGIGISILPAGYRTWRYGRYNYYSANGIYYRWNDFRRSYVVVDDPNVEIDVDTGTTSASLTELFVYPRQGQSSTQTSKDRYECYLWAVDQTGVEPAQVVSTDSANNLEDYQRANGACLEARGYSVK